MLLTCEDAKFLGFSEFLRRGVRPDQPRPGRGARRHTRQAKAHSLNSLHRAPRDSAGCGRRTGQPGDWTCRFARVRRQQGVANCANRVWRPIAHSGQHQTGRVRARSRTASPSREGCRTVLTRPSGSSTPRRSAYSRRRSSLVGARRPPASASVALYDSVTLMSYTTTKGIGHGSFEHPS